eukprot:scaffold10205_cov215-Skeletonema_marinoi.AAC.12
MSIHSMLPSIISAKNATMAPPTNTSIAIILCYCLLPAAILASQQATLTSSSPSSKSHVFHVTPSAVVNSVLSNIPRHPSRPFLDVDVSSSNLDDDAVVSLVEGMLTTQDGTTTEQTVLNLKLEMNRISPVGVSKVFDLLVGENNDNVVEEAAKETADDIQAVDNSDESQKNEASCVEDINVTATTIENASMDDEVETDPSQEEVTTPPIVSKPSLRIEKLDLSYNDIGGEGINAPSAQLLNSVRRLFENEDYSIIPNILLMENCGIGAAFCRSIGRGICNAFERNQIQSSDNTDGCLYEGRPSILRIGGNPAIGDAGAVALAAAFRMAASDDNNGDNGVIMEELDLSSCNIGDVGAEAISLALACNPSSLKRLDLSNNKITDVGAIALGRALIESRERTSGFALDQIILDNNALIGDDGAAALAKAVSAGAVRSVHLRSCSIRAEGAAEFGKALIEIVKHSKTRQFQSAQIEIDMSGNHFGISKPKKKKGAAYSASLLRDKASSNIKFIGKSLQSRIKGGFGMGLTTAESDDDEEEMGNVMGEILSDDEDVEEFDSDRLKAIARCGARLFSSEIINRASDSSVQAKQTNDDARLQIMVGMRQCCLDDGAIDALAAAKVGARKSGTILSIDITMNAGVDDATKAALKGDEEEELLSSIAERHSNEMKRILEAQERREAAAEVAAARVQEQDRFLEDDLFDDFDYDYDEY